MTAALPLPVQLRAWQRPMVEHMLRCPRCFVWAGMGMGKTLACLAALHLLEPVLRAPALIIAPLRVAQSTWPQEAARFAALGQRVDAITGTAAQRGYALAAALAAGAHCAINYEQLPWLVQQTGDAWPFDAIIADECTRLKSYRARQGSQRARALARVAHQSAHFIALTGTPAPNGLQDLWGQAWFIDRGQRLGRSYSAFTSRWFQSIPMGSHPAARELRALPHAQAQIHAALADVALTIEPADWLPLDAPIIAPVTVTLPAKAARIYRDMQRQLFAELDAGALQAPNAAARTAKCLQIASGAAYLGEEAGGAWERIHDAKLDALESIIEEASGEPLLVRYHWRHSAERICRRFPAARLLDKKPETIAAWNAGDIPLLLAHAASAGHGLNLQDGGCRLALFDHWWSLEEYQQLIERIGPVRQMQAGHPRPVFHHPIIAAGTLDEAVTERLHSKRSVQDALLQAMKKDKE